MQVQLLRVSNSRREGLAALCPLRASHHRIITVSLSVCAVCCVLCAAVCMERTVQYASVHVHTFYRGCVTILHHVVLLF